MGTALLGRLGTVALVLVALSTSSARAYICPEDYVSRLEVEWLDTTYGVVAVGAEARMLVHSGDCKHRFVVEPSRITVFVARTAEGPYERAEVVVRRHAVAFTPREPGTYFLRVTTREQATVAQATEGAIVLAYTPTDRVPVGVSDARSPSARAPIVLTPVLEGVHPHFLRPAVVVPIGALSSDGRRVRRQPIPKGTYELGWGYVDSFRSDDRPPIRGRRTHLSPTHVLDRLTFAHGGIITLTHEGATFAVEP